MPTLQKLRPGPKGPAPESGTKSSRIGEVAISALIIAILVTAVLSSIPSSTIKSGVLPVLIPIARATGLDQSWGMFAPNPPRSTSEIEVHVIMSDGSDRVWRPDDDSSMRKMQWRKFKEEVVNRVEYRPGLALYAIRQVTSETDRPVRVVMIVERQTLPLPGQGEPKTVKKLLLDHKLAGTASGAPK